MSSFRPFQKLHQGGFGKIYLTVNNSTKELCIMKKQPNNKTAKIEVQVLKAIQEHQLTGFPQLTHCFIENNKSCIVMEKLGPSILNCLVPDTETDTFVALPWEIVRILGMAMLGLIKNLHSIGYVHTDIKPDNFVFQDGFDVNLILDQQYVQKSQLYLIDFGLCQKYLNSFNKHPYQQESQLPSAGNFNFCSYNQMSNLKLSRKDDLESIFYNLVFLYKGDLPWSINATNMTQVQQEKKDFLSNSFCQDLPKQLLILYEYIDNLDFTEDPDYVFMQKILEEVPSDLLQINKRRKKKASGSCFHRDPSLQFDGSNQDSAQKDKAGITFSCLIDNKKVKSKSTNNMIKINFFNKNHDLNIKLQQLQILEEIKEELEEDKKEDIKKDEDNEGYLRRN